MTVFRDSPLIGNCGNSMCVTVTRASAKSAVERNPVKRGLVEQPGDWRWSSFRHYRTAEPGPVEIESQWTADRRNGRIPGLLQLPNE
jgi:hypothetical protein